jgi:hypothetical protein
LEREDPRAVKVGGKRLVAVTVALGGIALLVFGIERLSKLMAMGTVQPETLSRLVGETVGSLALGFALIIWCLVDGIT